jgi:hypothetical protein
VQNDEGTFFFSLPLFQFSLSRSKCACSCNRSVRPSKDRWWRLKECSNSKRHHRLTSMIGRAYGLGFFYLALLYPTCVSL